MTETTTATTQRITDPARILYTWCELCEQRTDADDEHGEHVGPLSDHRGPNGSTWRICKWCEQTHAEAMAELAQD